MTKTLFMLTPGISETKLYRSHIKDSKRADAEFSNVRMGILGRDANTCQGCGIRLLASATSPGGGLHVHHKDCNPKNNREENLITLCPLCHGIFHIGNFARRLGKAMRLIYCPEISQNNLNLLYWALSVALTKRQNITITEEEKTVVSCATQIRESLLKRTLFPKKYFPTERQFSYFTSLRNNKDIAFFGTVLGHVRKKKRKCYAMRREWLGGLRIFYDPLVPQVFINPHDRNGYIHQENYASWQPGINWAKTWLCIAKQFLPQPDPSFSSNRKQNTCLKFSS